LKDIEFGQSRYNMYIYFIFYYFNSLMNIFFLPQLLFWVLNAY